MTPRISLITAVAAAALAVGVPAAFGDNWGADRQDGATVVGSPDLADRVIAARQKELATMLDARERSLGTQRADSDRGTGTSDHFNANDNRFRTTPVNEPITAAVTGSGDNIEWPQIGFGVAIGVLFALGLMLVLRTARSRELAH
jgi:hypothetical protein